MTNPVAGHTPPALYIAIALYTAALAAIALIAVDVPPRGDDFITQADGLLRGELPRSPFWPTLYPLLIAGLGALCGDTFVAARLLGAVAAGFLAFTTYQLGRELFDRRAAAWSALLVAAHGGVMTCALEARTDIAFAALSGFALVAALRFTRSGRDRDLIQLGLFSALAYFTRYQGAVLLLLIGGALVLARLPWRARLRGVALGGAVVTLALTPHFVLTWLAFGTPLYDENWRNVALKYYGGMDFARLYELPFAGLADVLLHDPGTIFQGALRDLASMLRDGGLAALLQGTEPAGWIGWILVAAALAGAVERCRRQPRTTGLAAGYGAAYLLAVCVAFQSLARLLMPLVPLGLVAATGLIQRTSRHGPAVGTALLCVLAIGLLGHAHSTVATLLDRLPRAETAAARRLSMRAAFPMVILTTDVHPHSLPDRVYPGGIHAPYTPMTPDAYVARILARIHDTGASFVVLGRDAVGAELLRDLPAALPDSLTVVEADREVLVLRSLDRCPDWIASIVAIPTSLTGALEIDIRLRDDAVAAVEEVFLVVLGEGDAPPRALPLPLAHGHATLTLPTPRLPADGARLTALARGHDGRIGQGPVIRIEGR